jgi:hypothetical protein
MCTHRPTSDHHSPVIVSAHPEQGWSLRCDGTIVFDDTGELHPDGSVVAPLRTLAHALAA